MILEAGELRWIWEVLGVRAWGGYDQSIIYKIVKELKKLKSISLSFCTTKTSLSFKQAEQSVNFLGPYTKYKWIIKDLKQFKDISSVKARG